MSERARDKRSLNLSCLLNKAFVFVGLTSTMPCVLVFHMLSICLIDRFHGIISPFALHN